MLLTQADRDAVLRREAARQERQEIVLLIEELALRYMTTNPEVYQAIDRLAQRVELREGRPS